MSEPTRVGVTEAAACLLKDLTAQHGPLMFHQSGGCCDGSSPMCYPHGEFRVGGEDLHVGDIAGNAARILDFARRAKDLGADVMLTVLTPEGETAGYLAALTELSAGSIEGEKLDQVFRGVPVRLPETV